MKEHFQYICSDSRQDELKRIRDRYISKEESDMDRLRRLDAQVTQKAAMHAIIVGVIGAVILGMGLGFCVLWSGAAFIAGVIIGSIGLGVISLAYYLYEHTMKKERKRIAPEILRLTDALLK